MMRDVSFVSEYDGTEQKYVLGLPESFDVGASHDVLIALHGHGSDRWQFATHEGAEFDATRDVAAERRMIFVSPDYRAPTSWMGPAAEADVVQIIADLKHQYAVGKVFICGASMGGAGCLAFAAMHPELIDGVASMNGMANYLEYENFQEAIIASFGGTKQHVPQEYKKRSAEYWPEQLTMPIGLAVGGRDESVPPDSVLRLAQVLQANGHKHVKLIHRPDGGHETTYADAAAVLEFVIQSERRHGQETEEIGN